ncbi:hypothetical protein SAY86_025511 [Trapa natans]|uniref:Uncharacterized protein n=1 Tax=Trapa natans TaxID=22666 RepID=A0AAN7RJ45_TRANT|nr:hypothetical protein SAY86_025511 [Trapa natans]
MPGNGVGDRVHNSFGQENLSQEQHHFKTVDKNWPGLSNNIWVGSQTRNGFPPISNVRNYSVPQPANIDNGHGIPSFQAVNSLNAAQFNLSSEVSGSQIRNQQGALNGLMQGHASARRYEANFLGLDGDSYQNTVTSSDLSTVVSHHRNGTTLQKKDFGMFPNVQSPVNFNSFGGQGQMGSHPNGALQSFQRQQSGINDMQLMQQQMILRQLQDNQKQSFQNQGFWQKKSPFNMLPSMGNQAATDHSPELLNGIPLLDSSDKTLPELLASNLGQQHFGTTSIIRGYSSRFGGSSEQNQTLCSGGLIPQQCEQSLYGVPMPETKNNLSRTFEIQSENPAVEQISSFGNSFSRSQHVSPSDNATKDGRFVSRQVGSSDDHNSLGGFEIGNLEQRHLSQRVEPMQEFPGKLELGDFPNAAQDKTSPVIAHSQNSATLDPTEEKILFGSDENLWEAFGGEMSTCLGSFNMSDGTGSFGGFPSLQSGSWSALMQSALAETSRVETGKQEEWSSLSFRSTELNNVHRQLPCFNDGAKQEQLSARGENRLQAGSSSLVASGHQMVRKALPEKIEYLQTGSSARYIHGFSAGNKQLESSPMSVTFSESIPISGKVDISSMAERKQHSSHQPQIHQQNKSSHDAHSEMNDRANDWMGVGSRELGEGSNLKSYGSDVIPQPSQSSSHNSQVHEFCGVSAGKIDMIHGLPVGVDQLKPIGDTMLHRQYSSTRNVTVNSGCSLAFTENTHSLQNNQTLNFWRKVDSSENSMGSDRRGKDHRLGEDSKVFGPSGNNYMSDQQNSSIMKNSNSFTSNASCFATPGLLQENACTDGSNSHNLHGHKDSNSELAVQKSVGVPKFQYHPMGDLGVDMDSFHRSKANALPATNQQVPNKFFSAVGSGGSPSFNRTSQPSQNMLELLHKLDQSKEGEAASHFSSSDRNDVHEGETSDGSVGQLQGKYSSGNKGFGLQLAPPSEQLQNLDRIVYSQGSPLALISPHMSTYKSEIGDMPLITGPSNQSVSSSKEPNEAEYRNLVSDVSEQINGKFSKGFISEFPASRSHGQNQQDAERALPGQSVNLTLHRLPFHSKETGNSSEGTLQSQSIPPSVPDISAGTTKSTGASALEEARSEVRPPSGRLPLNSLVLEALSMFHHPRIPGASIGSGSSGTGEAAQSSLLGNLSSSNHVSHQSYSLLNQIHAMKSGEMNLNDRTWKRFRDLEKGFDSDTVVLGGNQQPYGQSAATGDVQPSHLRIDEKIFNLSGKGVSWDANSASVHMDALRRSSSPHSSSNDEAFFRHDHSQINPLEDIDHPRTLRSAQASPVPDAQKMAVINHTEQARLLQGPTDSMLAHEQANQIHDDFGASPASTRIENNSPQNLLPPEANDQDFPMKGKKRKMAATEVLAWHKEVMASGKLQSTSTTEIEWALAANCVAQKMEDGNETIEDGFSSVRPKKRLILSTQLMQQLIRPPPAPFLAGDNKSYYEYVTYCINKLALGDACQGIHFFSNRSVMPNSSDKIILEKQKVSDRSHCDNIVEAMEDVFARTKILENELSRLDQRCSMVELRVDLQDLERFSIINRFARFHGRNQSTVNGTSYSEPLSYASRPLPQRYVVALPMPKNLPDSIPCLSL